MSLLPLLYSTWWEGLNRPHYLHSQNFGMGIRPDLLLTQRQLMDSYYTSLRNRDVTDYYNKPVFDPLRKDIGGFSTITDDKDVFKVLLDVRLFKPNEVTVKLVDKFVVVEAKHMERQDEHGLITRQFVRKYLLPDVVDPDLIKTELSADGILVIKAPVKGIKKDEVEKILNIERTDKPLFSNMVAGDTQDIPTDTDRSNKEQAIYTAESDKDLSTDTTTDTTIDTTTDTITDTTIGTPTDTTIGTPTDTTIGTPTGTTIGTSTGTIIDTPTGTTIRTPTGTPTGTTIRTPTSTPTGTTIRIPIGSTTGTTTDITTGTTTRATTGSATGITTSTIDSTCQKLNEPKRDSHKIAEDKKKELERIMEDRKTECIKLTEEKKMDYENLMEERKKDERVENRFKLDEKKKDERRKF